MKVSHRMSPVIETALLARSSHRQFFDGSDEDVVRLPEAALTEMVERLATTVGQRIRQIVPFSPRQRVADMFSHLVSRELANSGTTVQRLYLVPAGDARNSKLNQLITNDRERNVDVRSLVVGPCAVKASGEGVARQPVLVPMRDIWLVDDQAVIRQDFGAEGPPEWVVSVRKQDVANARDLWSRLWDDRDQWIPDNAMLNPTDPLLESADMVHAAAQMSCTGDHVDEISCRWYHGVWQYLRLFNMVSSPRWHPEFYDSALRSQMDDVGARRVLICGTADYSTLAFVIEAADKCRDELDIHVLDRCPTPLSACKWYARRLGLDVKVHAMDVLGDPHELRKELVPRTVGRALGDFDLIVSDAFLTRFSPDNASRVLRRWARMLRPDGAVVTTVRLHPRNAERHGVTRDVSDFLLRLRDRAENWRWLLGIDFDELVEAAREYALKMTSRDLGDLPEVLNLFEKNGFKVLQGETARVEGELCETEYVRVVATV
jgi:SAM-dependent methyltransferase